MAEPGSSSLTEKHASAARIVDVLCGSTAGAMGKLIEYPFDTVKVRLQSQTEFGPQFKGPLDCLYQSLKAGGVHSIYRGISSPIVGAAAENASLFMTYNIFRKYFDSPLLCGALGGAVTSFVLTPIELIKCKIQVQSMPNFKSEKLGVWALTAEVYRKDGISGFWRGQLGTLLRETGGSAAWFGSYEFVGSKLREYYGRDENSISDSLIAGACAGMSYNLSLFPADTIKSRMQTESMLVGNSQGPATSSGFLSTGVSIYRSFGIKGLYRGCGITVARAAPSSAVIFLLYEKLKGFVHGSTIGHGELIEKDVKLMM
jgi:mitochondrial ornithine carrier protein